MTKASETIVAAGTVDEGLSNGWQLLANHPEAALQQAETLLKLGPEPRALRLAGAAHRKLGNIKKAQAAELVAIEAGLANPRLKAATDALQQGQTEQASAIAAAFLRDQPDDLLALAISAESAVTAGRLQQAEAMLRHILDRAPQFVQAAVSLARCLILQSRLDEAIKEMEELLRYKPNNVVALRLYARLLSDVRDFDGAASVFERLIAMDDSEIDLWINYSSTLRFMGRSQDAQIALRRALTMDERHSATWWQIADLAPSAVDDGDLARMRNALEDRRANHVDATNLNFALGLVLDRRGAHADAFEHFQTANAGRLKAQPYDPEATTAGVDRAIQLFAKPQVDRYKAWGNRDSSPIFLVGLPRSGSTLVERILGRHSRIEAAGELPIVSRLAEQFGFASGGQFIDKDALRNITADQVKDLGQSYLARSHAFRRTDKARFTDKMHMNWKYAGLIHVMLPNARFIDIRRNPLDCCWSNFKTQFAQGHPAANDLAHIGRFYRDYVRMMDHMTVVAPDRILRVKYEDVVDDIEGQTRRMLTFLGMDFEPECLDFHLSKEPVATASSEQVRRPLNREGIGAWKPYRQWLGPLIEALGPLADEELAAAERA